MSRAVVVLLLLAPTLFADVKFLAEKKAAMATIDRTAAEMTALSDKVWAYAEAALKENAVVESAG